MRIVLCVSVLTLATAASAQAPFERLTAESAQAIVAGCAAHAAKKQQSHAIAVVDGGGNPVAFLRMEGNNAGVSLFAADKAKAAALWGFPTAAMEQAIKTTPGFARAPHVVTVGGGAPIYSADGKYLLGGVGVSGEAPADDAACADAGIAAAELKSARS